MVKELESIMSQLFMAMNGILRGKCKEESLLHLEEAINNIGDLIYTLKTSNKTSDVPSDVNIDPS